MGRRTGIQCGQARRTPVLAASPTAPECGGLPMLHELGDPVSDHVGDVGVAVWIALGRAHHQGGVTNLAGQWRDSGSPVPGYLADALDRLTSSGQLALAVADPESCGARRVTVTDTGYARYVILCQVHNCPDSARPPAETAPGSRPDTTAPVDSAGLAGDAAGGDPQRGTLGAGQVVINPGVHRGTPRPTDLPVIDSPDPRSGEPVGLPPVVEGLLVDVVEDGFVLYCCGHRAGPNALVASYQWEHCIDLVTIRDFDWVTVARVPTPHPGQVDVFAPEVVMWAREGPPQWSLRALLNLVHPAHPEAPSTISPAPPSLHIPRVEQRPLTIRPPSPVRAGVRATRLGAALPAGSRQ